MKRAGSLSAFHGAWEQYPESAAVLPGLAPDMLQCSEVIEPGVKANAFRLEPVQESSARNRSFRVISVICRRRNLYYSRL